MRLRLRQFYSARARIQRLHREHVVRHWVAVVLASGMPAFADAVATLMVLFLALYLVHLGLDEVGNPRLRTQG